MRRSIACALTLMATFPTVRAGEPPPAAPNDAASARFTLGDIYGRLTTGAAGTKRGATFAEPVAGPATFTMYTTDQLMAAAPAADNTNGATTANVMAGKTFWGLRTDGTWGLKTGALTTQTPSAATTSQPAGVYAAFNLATVDADLTSSNVRSGVSIFGVAGSPNVVNTSTGTAVAAEIVAGKKAWVAGAELTGSLSAQTPSAATTSQTAGVYAAFDLATVDADLTSSNVRSGVSIFGVAGNPNVVNTSTGTAVAGEIVAGKKAWVAGTEVTGSLSAQTPNAASTSQAAGVYAAFNLATVDPDLAAGNVLSGVTIFGVSGTAAAGASYSAGVPKTGQKACYNVDVLTACPGTPAGQDGALQKGVAFPSPRFTDNGNQTVTDHLTGLIWLKDADCFGSLPWLSMMNNANTLAQGGANGGCNLTDGSVAGAWRVPNVREMQSLVDYNDAWSPVPNPFLNVANRYYWTSSTYVATPNSAWIVGLIDGGVKPFDKNTNYSMWPVRGGP